MKKKLCSCVFLKVSIDHLCGNLESGKRNCCFWKKSRKFCIQKSERTLQLAFWPSITEILPALPNLWEIVVDLNLWWEFVKFVYTSVADPGEGPGGFRPNRGPKGRKNFFGRPPPAPLSNGLDDRPQPPPLPTISRSGSGTTISILNFCLMNKGSSFLRSDNFYIWMWSMLK